MIEQQQDSHVICWRVQKTLVANIPHSQESNDLTFDALGISAAMQKEVDYSN